MLFNSLSFLFFLPIVFFIYYALPSKFQKTFLLMSSCFFYASFVPKYLIILFGLVTTDFLLAITLNKYEGKKRKRFLYISIFTNIGTLVFFRYFNFFNENIASLANFLHWNYSLNLLNIALPIGLSFHVFQSLSYVIEVYRKKYTPETNYITYALYVMFFPQLVAGPIERPSHLLPQINSYHIFNITLARKGLERMLWGFFKKMVIADQISQIINPLYENLPKESLTLIVMAILFAYQLYCDFSGYSDIAIGSAMLFGYDLTENFNRPYSSRSFAEFWRRWHMSLSNWLRDYMYYPLALTWAKGSRIKLYLSLVITFFLIGIWHGANFTFAVFGLINGFYLVLEAVTEKVKKKIFSFLCIKNFEGLQKMIETIIVFLGMCVSFIFFRSETVYRAFEFLKGIFVYKFGSFKNLFFNLTVHSGNVILIVVFLSIFVLELVQFLQAKNDNFFIFDRLSKYKRYSWYYVLVVSILFFGYFGAQTFIYFQF